MQLYSAKFLSKPFLCTWGGGTSTNFLAWCKSTWNLMFLGRCTNNSKDDFGSHKSDGDTVDQIKDRSEYRRGERQSYERDAYGHCSRGRGVRRRQIVKGESLRMMLHALQVSPWLQGSVSRPVKPWFMFTMPWIRWNNPSFLVIIAYLHVHGKLAHASNYVEESSRVWNGSIGRDCLRFSSYSDLDWFMVILSPFAS